MEENRDKNISHFMQTMILFRKKIHIMKDYVDFSVKNYL